MKVVLEALRESGGNRSLAAQRLGISRATLHRRLARYRKLGIPVPERVSR
jgi:transcriptional regulator of acetoin/glycerol metabolism